MHSPTGPSPGIRRESASWTPLFLPTSCRPWLQRSTSRRRPSSSPRTPKGSAGSSGSPRPWRSPSAATPPWPRPMPFCGKPGQSRPSVSPPSAGSWRWTQKRMAGSGWTSPPIRLSRPRPRRDSWTSWGATPRPPPWWPRRGGSCACPRRPTSGSYVRITSVSEGSTWAPRPLGSSSPPQGRKRWTSSPASSDHGLGWTRIRLQEWPTLCSAPIGQGRLAHLSSRPGRSPPEGES